MLSKREETIKPAWSQDQLDSSIAPEVEAPYFDSALDAWVFSRYEDVLAAFRASSLSPAGFNNENGSNLAGNANSLKMRAETLDALSPAQLRAWKTQLTDEVDKQFANLNWKQPINLLGEYAQPLCLFLAAMVTGIHHDNAVHIYEKARQVSASSAEPFDQTLRSQAKSANAELKKCFHTGPDSLRDSGFVALSQTLPCVLGNAWFALTQYPEEWLLLHQQPGLIEQAIEELLRYAGLARILFRTATADVDINGSFIRTGQRIVLRVIAANRDPERFPQPNQLDITRRAAGHLTLGSGLHSCVGASLIRMAVIAITYPLIRQFAQATLAQPVVWQGGTGFSAPRSLFVLLNETE
jgi:cytochrome P450